MSAACAVVSSGSLYRHKNVTFANVVPRPGGHYQADSREPILQRPKCPWCCVDRDTLGSGPCLAALDGEQVADRDLASQDWAKDRHSTLRDFEHAFNPQAKRLSRGHGAMMQRLARRRDRSSACECVT
jgi:hypothetical protein